MITRKNDKSTPRTELDNLSLRQYLILTLGAVAVFAVLLAGMALLGDEIATPGIIMLVFPVILGVNVIWLPAAFYRLQNSQRFPMAVLWTALLGAVSISLSTWLATVLSQQFPQQRPLSWNLVLAGVCAVGAWLLHELKPRRRAVGGQIQSEKTPDDDAWLAATGAALRRRNDLSDQRVEQVLQTVRTETAEAGDSLHEHAGTPESFAASVPSEPGVRPTRELLLYAVVVIGWAISTINAAHTDMLGANWHTFFLSIWGLAALFLVGHTLRRRIRERQAEPEHLQHRPSETQHQQETA